MGWALVNSFVRLMETVMPCSSSIGPIQVFNLDQVKHNFTTKFYLLNHVQIENLFGTCPKQYGLVQNCFGPTEGQGIRLLSLSHLLNFDAKFLKVKSLELKYWLGRLLSFWSNIGRKTALKMLILWNVNRADNFRALTAHQGSFSKSVS